FMLIYLSLLLYRCSTFNIYSLSLHDALPIYEADIILLNTCAIRENAENKVFGEIGHLKPLKLEKPDLILGVCGCMSQQESSQVLDRKSTRLNSSHVSISYAVFCLKKKKT